MTNRLKILRDSGYAAVFNWSQELGPALVYWGDDSADLEVLDQWQVLQAATTRAHMDHQLGVLLAPDLSRGSLQPSILLAHSHSKQFAQQFRCEHARSEGRGIVFGLFDRTAGLQLDLDIRLDGANRCLKLRTQLRNIGDLDWTIDHLGCPCLPLPSAFRECITFPGRWGGEFRQQRSTLGEHALLIEHREGRTGPQHQPSVVVGNAGFDNDQGQLIGAHLGWSGNYQLRVERFANGTAALQAGVWFFPGEQQLAPQQQLTTPWLYAVQSDAGTNAMSQSFHQHLRQHILPSWTRDSRPIHANSWEAVYFDHRQQTLFDLIDAASAAGAERFVLDDGWFTGRRDDTSALGDWTVCADVYPDGLHPIVQRVHERGLQFGLWVEPEMINPNSDLARAHPEWILQTGDRDNPTARNQWVLDISRNDAYQYIKQCLIALLDEYPIVYLKWDMNRPLVQPGGCTGTAVAAAQVYAMYQLMDELIEHQPGLEIESCSSGGGRIDAGVFERTGRAWASDNNDPVERVAIQSGFSMFFPPELMGAHVGPHSAHLTGRETSLDFRLLLALQGQFGLEVDARHLSHEELLKVQQAATLYQRHRNWIGEAKVWRWQREGVDFCAYVSADQSQVLLWALAGGALAGSIPPPALVPGLKKSGRYRAQIMLPTNTSTWLRFANDFPPWLAQDGGVVCGASLLQKVGLALPVLAAQTGLLVYLSRESE